MDLFIYRETIYLLSYIDEKIIDVTKLRNEAMQMGSKYSIITLGGYVKIAI